jgi:hypothetical protein
VSERLRDAQSGKPRKTKSGPDLPPPIRTEGTGGAYTITRFIKGGVEVIFYDPNDREVHRFQEKIPVTVNIVVGAPAPADQQMTTDWRANLARATEANKGKPFQLERDAKIKQVERNLRGRELEREGHVDNAVELYQANVQEGFEGNHPYDRLATIYRQRKDYASEVAVLERAVEVFKALVESSPRSDVQTKLAKFRERLSKARQLAGEGAQG